MTVEKLQAAYDKTVKVWQSSTCRTQLLKILDQAQPDEGWQIKEAICLASGSFSRDNWEGQKRSMHQFVAFMDIVQHVQKSSSETVEVIAQEMIYTHVDVDFLSAKGITVHNKAALGDVVYKNPDIREALGPQSMVFEAFMDMTTESIQQLLDTGMRLYIGSSLQGNLMRSKTDLQDWVKQFLNDHGSQYFPRFEEDPNVFNGLMIYWRQPSDEDDAG